MRLRTWKTADVPAADRFDAWSEALSSTHLDWELVGTEPDFEAKVVERTVGDLRLIGCRCDPCEGFRSPRHVNRGDGDYIGILFELSGLEIVRQGDREATLRPGDFVIWDSSKAMEFRVLEPLHKMTILVPKASMRRFLPGSTSSRVCVSTGPRAWGRWLARTFGSFPLDSDRWRTGTFASWRTRRSNWWRPGLEPSRTSIPQWARTVTGACGPTSSSGYRTPI